MKHVFVEQNIREPVVNYSSFLSDGRVMNFLLPNVLRAKWKGTRFFISKSIFRLSLRLLREDDKFRLKVANEVASQPKLLRSC